MSTTGSPRVNRMGTLYHAYPEQVNASVPTQNGSRLDVRDELVKMFSLIFHCEIY